MTKLETLVQNAVSVALGLSPEQHAPATTDNPIFDIGSPVIVRSRDAGVIFGEYDGNDGDTVHVTNARQMWSWTAAKGFTLIDCANHGISKGKISGASATLTVFNACAIIPCTSDAAKIIGGFDAHL